MKKIVTYFNPLFTVQLGLRKSLLTVKYHAVHNCRKTSLFINQLRRASLCLRSKETYLSTCSLKLRVLGTIVDHKPWNQKDNH